MDHRYKYAHNAVRREYGPATLYTCLWCGGRADQWAYDHRDPDELTDPRGLPYSLDISHYGALCVRCHRSFDRLLRRNVSTFEFAHVYFRACRRYSREQRAQIAKDCAKSRTVYAGAAKKVPRALAKSRAQQRAYAHAVMRDDALTTDEQEARLIALLECIGWGPERIARSLRNGHSRAHAERAVADAKRVALR